MWDEGHHVEYLDEHRVRDAESDDGVVGERVFKKRG